MNNIGVSKKRILKSLKSKDKTLTDLSYELNLSPSTVHEHLKHLIASGEIQPRGSRYSKWKFYGLPRATELLSPSDPLFQGHRIITYIES